MDYYTTVIYIGATQVWFRAAWCAEYCQPYSNSEGAVPGFACDDYCCSENGEKRCCPFCDRSLSLNDTCREGKKEISGLVGGGVATFFVILFILGILVRYFNRSAQVSPSDDGESVESQSTPSKPQKPLSSAKIAYVRDWLDKSDPDNQSEHSLRANNQSEHSLHEMLRRTDTSAAYPNGIT